MCRVDCGVGSVECGLYSIILIASCARGTEIADKNWVKTKEQTQLFAFFAIAVKPMFINEYKKHGKIVTGKYDEE